MKTVEVVLCCNDVSGSFTGCTRAVKVYRHCHHADLYLAAISLDQPPRVSFAEFGGVVRLIKISGRAFPVLRYSACQPALTANAFLMETVVAAEFLNFLKSKGRFASEGGSAEFGEVWSGEGRKFDPQLLESPCAI